MRIDDVASRFARIAPTSEGHRYPLDPLAVNVHLSRTAVGEPALLFVLESSAGLSALSSSALHLEFHPRVDVQVRGQTKQHAVAILACTEVDLLREFAVLALDVHDRVMVSGDALTDGEAVRELFMRWKHLFKPRAQPSFGSIVGLWGELRFIDEREDLDAIVRSWHGPEAGVHDFAGNGICVEVKTSVRGHEHEFALEQIVVPDSIHALVRSACIRLSPADGMTVADLVRRIGARLAAPTAFEKKMMELGYDPSALNVHRFREESVTHHAVTDIPRPRAIDSGVKHIHFVVDLSSVAALSSLEVSKAISRLLRVPAQ